MPIWPAWWEWELAFTRHLEKRMEDRGFTEVELRDLLERASSYRVDVVPGCFVILTSRKGQEWEVIVEPDAIDGLLVVITAYRIGS